MAEVKNIELLVLPAEKPKSSPYANSTFTFAHSPTDVTLVFMQAPLLLDDEVIKLGQAAKDGQATVNGQVVASITLPRVSALGLARKLVELLGGEKSK